MNSYRAAVSKIGGLISGAGLALALPMAGAELSGKAILIGKPPPEVVVDLTEFPDCRQNRPERFTTRHYRVAPDGGLANVFVFIQEGLAGLAFPVPTNAPVLDQIRCEFQPYLMGVQTRQKFKIKNSEPYLNNVHAMPKLNREFNLAQPMQGMVTERQFDKPEVLIRLKCDIHPWEFAFIGVVDHPFFTVTDSEGAFKLPPGLPAGAYTIAAVHPKAGTRTEQITLSSDDKKQVNFVFEVKPVKK